jgi:hypothetical protein
MTRGGTLGIVNAELLESPEQDGLSFFESA